MSLASKALLVALSAAAPFASAGENTPGLEFSHHDWEIVCDNSRTCRAAGYQSDEDEFPMSVLLTRKAGAGAAVSGQLMLGTADDEAASPYAKLPKVFARWMAAYNMGEGYWVVDDAPPYRPVLVTVSGSDFHQGTISSSHKGRGIGDCWSSEEWTWDGAQFVHTGAASTGMCKLVAAGGAWHLPRIVTEVHPPAR